MEPRARGAAFAQLFIRSEPGGLLYGAVVSGSAMAAISAHSSGEDRIAVPALVVLGIYWLAHVYIHTIAKQLRGSDTRPLLRRAATSAREEVPVLLGGLPAVAVYLALDLLGASSTTAVFIALCFLICLLFTVGYVGAKQVGLTGRPAIVEAAGAGFFGVLILIMKTLLH